jgi:hypothetical protein
MPTLDAPDYKGFQYRTYDLPVIVLVANNSTAKLTTNITLPVGVLRRYRCKFRKGCNNRIYVQLFHGATQILPYVVGTYFNENDILIDINPVYCEIPTGAQVFSVVAWNDNDTTALVNCNHTIDSLFDVEVGGI